MKLVIIVLVVVIILAGGSFSVLKWMQIGPFASDPEPEPEEIEQVVPEGPPVFIDLEPLIINIFHEDEIVSVVEIMVKLEVLGMDNAGLVNESIPIITDYFLRDMHAFLPRIMNDNETQSDIFVIKKRLKLLADSLFPNGRINDVLIQSVNQSF